MGTSNGTWVPSYQSFDDHEKTARIAGDLVALGVPEGFAVDVAFGQWKRLAFRLLNGGLDGRLLAMTPRAFAHIVRWDDMSTAKQLWDAWMRSGFIDDPGTPEARLHDFQDTFGHIIGARERAAVRRQERRAKFAGQANQVATMDSAAETQVREQFADSSRTIPEPFANSSPSCARDRTGPDRTGPDILSSLPPSPPPASSPPAGGAKGKPSAPKAPTVELCEAWRRIGEQAGYPAVAVNGQTAKVLADAWRASGADPGAAGRVEAAIRAFFADRSDFVVRQGHSIGEFSRTASRWLAAAAGTAPRAAARAELAVGGATRLLFGGGA